MAAGKPVALFEIGRPVAGPRLLLTGPPDDPAAASPGAFREAWREALLGEELLPIPIGEAERRRLAPLLGAEARVAGVGLGRRLGLFLIRPPRISVEEALRAVEAEAVRQGLGPLPAAWAAPFLWLEGLRLPADVSEAELLMVGRTLRGLCLLLRRHPGPNAPRRPERQAPLLRRMETRRLLPRLWTAPGEDDPPRLIGEIPMGGVDAALAWIEAGAGPWRRGAFSPASGPPRARTIRPASSGRSPWAGWTRPWPGSRRARPSGGPRRSRRNIQPFPALSPPPPWPRPPAGPGRG